MNLQWLPSPLPSSKSMPSGWHMHEPMPLGWHMYELMPSVWHTHELIPSGWHMYGLMPSGCYMHDPVSSGCLCQRGFLKLIYIILKGPTCTKEHHRTLYPKTSPPRETMAHWQLESWLPTMCLQYLNALPTPKCFTHLLLLRGENMAHLTSWFLHGCAISL